MIADPFNYPFPNRADTMTLSTISNSLSTQTKETSQHKKSLLGNQLFKKPILLEALQLNSFRYQ